LDYTGKSLRFNCLKNLRTCVNNIGVNLWGRGYFVATTGTVTDEIIKEYIEHQDSDSPDDDFRIGS